ncbi:MAG: 50S ribosomal protein L2 [Candidatus Sungbacteria bacterium]|nr:50S ribosomal protein L2 [Candidatus Sungbacteria bacterium]
MKRFSPTSPSRRQAEYIDWRSIVTRKEPEKSLTFGRKRHVGRNSAGRITTRHKGGGVKRLWREIDFLYDKKDIPATITTVEYDPNRTSFVALLVYRDGTKRYTLLPQGVSVGGKLLFSELAPLEAGNRMPISKIPVGTFIYNIELTKGKGAQLVRSAGSSAVILAQEGEYAHIELPSKEVRLIRSENWASIGALSNPENSFMTIGFAGRARRMGIRPSVRGSAMNPVDHPHGGGEGRALIGRRRGPATPWGKLARGVKTRKRKNRSDKFIVERRK